MQPFGYYRRELGANIERLIENALDWEHLPYLHDSSFEAIQVINADATGWTADARLAGGMKVSLDLRLDRANTSWITRTAAAGKIVSEIVSIAHARDAQRCHVEVEFRMAGVTRDRCAAMEKYYRTLYAKLYDEDEAMMVARAEALRLGSRARRERRTVTLASGGEAQVPLRCPHWGLPLTADPDDHDIITCPWHGYRFDARTGACVRGQSCRW